MSLKFLTFLLELRLELKILNSPVGSSWFLSSMGVVSVMVVVVVVVIVVEVG